MLCRIRTNTWPAMVSVMYFSESLSLYNTHTHTHTELLDWYHRVSWGQSDVNTYSSSSVDAAYCVSLQVNSAQSDQYAQINNERVVLLYIFFSFLKCKLLLYTSNYLTYPWTWQISPNILPWFGNTVLQALALDMQVN